MDHGSVEGRGKMETLKQDSSGPWGREVHVKPGARGGGGGVEHFPSGLNPSVKNVSVG